jgi:hypothetical protein
MAQTNPIYIPTFINSEAYAPARVLPHIYFFNGNKPCKPFWFQGYNDAANTVIPQQYSSFPYFGNYSGIVSTSDSISLLFNNEETPYGDIPTESLYTQYWETYITLLYNPKTRLINCSGIIPLANYFDMELNDVVFWRGNYYHLRAINDYNISTGECQLQLLGPIIPDTLQGLLGLDCNFDFTQRTA